MLCNKCNALLNDESKFCTNCGEPNPNFKEAAENVTANVQSTVNAAASNAGATAQSAANSNFADYRNEEPKKKLPKALLIGGVAALAVAGVAVGSMMLGKSSNPVDHFKKVMKSNSKTQVESTGKFYKRYLSDAKEYKEGATESKFTVALPESELKTTLNSLAMLGGGVDIGWLNSIGVVANGNVKDGQMTADFEYLINDKSALSGNFYFGENEFLAQIPDLSDKYMDLSSFLEGQMDMSAVINAQGKYIDSLPDADTFQKLMEKYSTLWLEDVKDVKSEKSEVTAEGISQDATKLSVSLDGEQLKALYKKYLEELKEDKELEGVIVNYVDGLNGMMSGMGTMTTINDGQSTYDSMIRSIEDELKELENSDASNAKMDIDIWVDGSDKVVATRFHASSDNSDAVSELKLPRKGSDFGVEYSIDTEGSKLRVNGKAKYDGGKLSGDFKAYSNDEHVLNLNVKNFDVKQFEEGKFVFDADLSLVDGTTMTQGIGVSVDGYVLSISSNSTAKDADIAIVLRKDDKDVLSLNLTGKYLGKKDLTKPSGETVDMADDSASAKYMQEANWAGLIEKLRQTDIPSEYIDSLEGLTRMYQ